MDMKDDTRSVYRIVNYQKKKTFSSFLSGIAGHMGIPMWAFYVNRGQLIASFGLQDKNGAIMEFYPANQAYHYVSVIGFRTFLKVDGHVIECFKEHGENQVLSIAKDQVSITETNEESGFEIAVTYYTLPNALVAGLVRKVEIKNLRSHPREFEIVDGLTQILPAGVRHGNYKSISNLLQSWMRSEHEENFVFYRLTAQTGDSAEVKSTHDGNFYLTKGLENQVHISDYKLIFDEDTSLSTPYGLIGHSVKELGMIEQVHVNQVPCAMSASAFTLSDRMTFYGLYGHAKDKDTIRAFAQTLDSNYFSAKEEENRSLHEQLVRAVSTKTSRPLFDDYVKQSYFDNVLRGGKPWVIETKNKKIGYYIYSRKHGDLERDYNFFNLEPSFFSQGNGNFRDVLQNRRNDIFFEPEIGAFNLDQFVSLIQADGYNPLSIEGLKFHYQGTTDGYSKSLASLLEKPFTPGMLATLLDHEQTFDETFMKRILASSVVTVEANYGEGYWEDHFTYHYDLIDAYLSIYPDRVKELMFEGTYPFFVSPVEVVPRREKYVLREDGEIRQYGALKSRKTDEKWLSNEDGPVLVNLFGKLMILVLNKFGHLDPAGIGLSYEANKPGWNDAMNGLPGLFGSGVSETIELRRIVCFLKSVARDHPEGEVSLLESVIPLIERYVTIEETDEMKAWDLRMSALEDYRESLKGTQTVTVSKTKDVLPVLDVIDRKLEKAIDAAKRLDGVMPTYLVFNATSYQAIIDAEDKPVIGNYGLPVVKINGFEMRALPAFLEAPARYLKGFGTKDEGMDLYRRVRKSGLYDQKLAFYQTSESLSDWSHEIGRIRAFTPGWLERESNFLHMTYKYLLGLLKAGLYDVFYEEIETNLTCFMDPMRYGRSPLENCSFLATSSNPDSKKHGQGFVSRLTGSTAEVLSMWRHMFLGDHLFDQSEGILCFSLSPKLSSRFFKDGIVEVRLFGSIDVTYHNQTGLDTYDPRVSVSRMIVTDETKHVIPGGVAKGDIAQKVREKNVKRIDVYFHAI